MALADFLVAVKQAAAQYAPQYGLPPEVLEHALIVAAGLEGGLGETAGVGDGGYSVGRFQFYMNGGHGTTLLNQGYTPEQIADDVFQAFHWAPLMAQSIVNSPNIATAIFNLERPAEPYPPERLLAASQTATGITGYSMNVGYVGAGGGKMPPEYFTLLDEFNALAAKDEAGQAYIEQYQPVPAELQLTAQERLRMETLARELDKMEVAAGWDENGAPSPQSVIAAYDFYNRNNPDAIAAEEAANRYAREMQAVDQAGSQARAAIQDQQERAQRYDSEFATASENARQGIASGPAGAANSRKYSGDELFEKALAKIKANLPEVPNRPAPSLPAGGPEGILGYGRGATGTPVSGQSAAPKTGVGVYNEYVAPGGVGVTPPSGPVSGPGSLEGIQAGDSEQQFNTYRMGRIAGSIVDNVTGMFSGRGAKSSKPKEESMFRIPAAQPRRQEPTKKAPKFSIRPGRK